MKKFLTIDFYLQISVLTFTTIYIALYSLAGKSDLLMYFYYIIGFAQLVSFITRYFLGFNKSILYKIYGYLIMPIWTILFFAIILQGASINLGVFNQIAGIFLYYLVLSLFFSPVLSVVYIVECYLTDRNYEK